MGLKKNVLIFCPNIILLLLAISVNSPSAHQDCQVFYLRVRLDP